MKASLLCSIVLNALIVSAVCPFMDADSGSLRRRDEKKVEGDDGYLDQFVVEDKDDYTTTDSGTLVDDRNSLKAGVRGGTLLEDFVFRTKITRFDHERIPERAGMFPIFILGGKSENP
jgi:catalase